MVFVNTRYKMSEDRRKSNDKFREVFGSRAREVTSAEEESLEGRLSRLIRHELQRTRGESELSSLENRIIRILRNEFVNDIMREVNAVDDEISSWFRRFLRSVPELSEAYSKANEEGKEGERRQCNGVTKKGSGSDENESSVVVSMDERIMDHVMEMFRVPIQITCRAGGDMRRVIRAGRRMMREIEMLGRVRCSGGGGQAVQRRVERKCLDELDHMGARRPSTAAALGGWRHVLRRRWRDTNPVQRTGGWYYVVLDRLDKTKTLPKLMSNKTMSMKFKKIRPWKILPYKGRSKRRKSKVWSEIVAKAEIACIMSQFRRLRWISCLSTPPCDANNNNNKEQHSETTQSEPRMSPSNTNTKELMDSTSFETSRRVREISSRTCVYSSPFEVQNLNTSTTQAEEYSPSQENCLNEAENSTDLGMSLPMDSRPFAVTFDTNPARPEDIRVVLFADRVLEVSVFSHLPDEESNVRRHRWMLSESVQVDNLQCILEDGILVITEHPLSSHALAPRHGTTTVLGPPTRDALSCPRPP